MKIPITICLFTSTKGHFDIKTRYLETVKSLDSQIPLKYFHDSYANIATSSNETDIMRDMASNLQKYKFRVYQSSKDWSHGDVSHQRGYINDMIEVYNNLFVLSSPYVLHLEDDWILHCYEYDLQYWLNKAIEILEAFPDVVQVRFARFANEMERINNLNAKHGINGMTISGDKYFLHNDFSANPSIFRPRDLQVALKLMQKNPQSFPTHVEHGLGASIKYLFDSSFPFACLDPKGIKARHIGTKPGEEDGIEPLNSD